MALRAVIDHPKFIRLKLELGIAKYQALGLLETLWHFTGRYTPCGDIGRYEDSDIEAWIEWDGEPGVLIAALVKSHWLDKDKTHRLVVHDWAQHADSMVHIEIAKKTKLFISGERPKIVHEGFSGQTRTRIKAEYDAKYPNNPDCIPESSRQCPDSVPTIPVPVPVPVPDSNYKQEEIYKQDVITSYPILPKSEKSAGRLENFGAIWEAFESSYPRRRGDLDKKKAKDKLKALIGSGKPPALILAGVTAYKEFCDREDKTGTSLVAMMTTWLNGERWNEDYSAPAHTNGKLSNYKGGLTPEEALRLKQ